MSKDWWRAEQVVNPVGLGFRVRVKKAPEVCSAALRVLSVLRHSHLNHDAQLQHVVAHGQQFFQELFCDVVRQVGHYLDSGCGGLPACASQETLISLHKSTIADQVDGRTQRHAKVELRCCQSTEDRYSNLRLRHTVKINSRLPLPVLLLHLLSPLRL